MLNIYFTNMCDVILANNGTIDKFIGDAIMAFWGAPVITKDHRDKALNSAVNMIKRVRKINEELKTIGLGDYRLKVGIGLNSGDAIVGSIGSEKKLDFTVIGDTVNLASRLESQTKNYGAGILISEFTYEGLKNRYPCRAVDMVQVKGKERKVKIYQPMVTDQDLSRERAEKLCKITNEAFEHYSKGELKKAKSLYEKIEDGPLKDLFVKRCGEGLEK